MCPHGACTSYPGRSLSLAGIPQKPIITGYKSSLREKETATLHCQSSGSKPAAQLIWRKGDQELRGEYLLSWGCCRRRWLWSECIRPSVRGTSRNASWFVHTHLCVRAHILPIHTFLFHNSLCLSRLTLTACTPTIGSP